MKAKEGSDEETETDITALCNVLACDSSGIFTCPFLTFTDWELPQPGSLSVEWVSSVKTLEVRASY